MFIHIYIIFFSGINLVDSSHKVEPKILKIVLYSLKNINIFSRYSLLYTVRRS